MNKTNIFIEDLSEEAKKELKNLTENKENAFDMLLKNYSGEQELNTQDIVARMQMQFFATDPMARELKSADNDGWEQSEYYEPNELNLGLTGLVKTEDNKSFYSSFALKELEGVYNLRYPLDDSFATASATFADDSMPDYEYKNLIKKLEQNLKIKVREDDVYAYPTYKTNFFKTAIVKIKNAFLKLTKNYDKIKVAYAGCIKLNNKKGNYVISNVEKVVKIYDSVFGATIKKQAYLLKKEKGIKVTKDLSFASRIYANLLMSRVTNFGNAETNKKVEKSLALQFANILNRNNFGPEDLKIITELATRTAADACKSMNITTEQIVARMTLNGYDYSLIPSNEFEALLYYKERDYNKYEANMQEKEEEKPKKLEKITEKPKTSQEILYEEMDKFLNDQSGFNFIRNGRVADVDKVEPKITKEQIERVAGGHVSEQDVPKPERKKFSDTALVKNIKKVIDLLRAGSEEDVQSEFTAEELQEIYDKFIEDKKGFGFIVNELLDEKEEPQYPKITKEQIEKVVGEYVSVQDIPAPVKTKKKFSDLKLIKGLKNIINKIRSKTEEKEEEPIDVDKIYKEFIEDKSGFGFVTNELLDEKEAPKYDKITKEQIERVAGRYVSVQDIPKPERKKFSDTALVKKIKKIIDFLRAGSKEDVQSEFTSEELQEIYDKFIEDKKGFGFIVNELLDEKEAPKYDKITKEQIDKALNKEPNEIKQEPILVGGVPEVPLLPSADDMKRKELLTKFVDVLVAEIEDKKNSKDGEDVGGNVIIEEPVPVKKGKLIKIPEGNVAKINKEQIQKFIDKVIEDQLKDISVKIDNAIASKQYFKYGGKKHCEKIKELCVSVARYYAMHANNQAAKKIKSHDAVVSIDGMAKFACGMLIDERNNLVVDLLEGQKDDGPQRRVSDTGRYENIDTVINRMFRKYKNYRLNKERAEMSSTSTVEPFINEDTVKSHFKVYIKKVVIEYGKLTKKESKIKINEGR